MFGRLLRIGQCFPDTLRILDGLVTTDGGRDRPIDVCTDAGCDSTFPYELGLVLQFRL